MAQQFSAGGHWGRGVPDLPGFSARWALECRGRGAFGSWHLGGKRFREVWRVPRFGLFQRPNRGCEAAQVRWLLPMSFDRGVHVRCASSQDGDLNQLIYPAQSGAVKTTVPARGPDSLGREKFWMIRGMPGEKIEVFLEVVQPSAEILACRPVLAGLSHPCQHGQYGVSQLDIDEEPQLSCECRP